MPSGLRRLVREFRWTLEPLGEAGPLNRMLTVGTRNFTAKPRGRENLSGIAEPRGIEGASQTLHRLQIVLAEHSRQVSLFIGSDAVLARDRSPGVDAVLENFRRHGFGVRRLTRDRFIVANQRMEIAVAGMKDVANRQARPLLELADPAEHFRQLRSGHHSVLHVVARRHASHGRECRFAPFPDTLALPWIARDLYSERATLFTDAFDDREQFVNLDARTIKLHDQHGIGVREVRMN